MDEKCSHCTRMATRGLKEIPSMKMTWFCTFHWNGMIRDRRISRRIAKAARRTPEQPA